MNAPFDPGKEASRLYEGDALAALKALPSAHFDLVVSSPPYNIGKRYERTKLSIAEYAIWQEKIVRQLTRVIRSSGSVCWQTGSHVKDGEVVPLDIIFYRLFKKFGWKLRNRIIWRFNFGFHSDRRFSGRYETILWFTKTENYKFNLDPVRVPQLYPGKRHASTKGARAGRPSGNPQGKNPSDYWEFDPAVAFLEDPVWNVPNVKANHLEYTGYPCQFPVELAERCVLAMTDKGDVVLDPFVGSGSTVVAAVKHKRLGVGIDRDPEAIATTRERLEALALGQLPMRPMGIPPRSPAPRERVSVVPVEWSGRDKGGAGEGEG